MALVGLELARRLELAQARRSVEYSRASGRWDAGQADALPVAGGYAVCSGAGLPVNRATGLGMAGPVTRSDLERVAQFFHSHGMASRVDLCPLADASLLDLLRVDGYLLEGFLNVLYCHIGECMADSARMTSVCPEVRVIEVGPEGRDLWLRTAAQGFSELEEPPDEVLRILVPNFDSAIATCFLAYVNGEPAGAGAIVSHEGAVELCSDSTRPAFRRQGVQAALLRARLAAARKAGCDLALALTTPGTASQRNIERVGLRLAYTRAEMVEGSVGSADGGFWMGEP